MNHASNNLQSTHHFKKSSRHQASVHTRIPHALTGEDCKDTLGGVLLSELLSLERGYFKIWRKIKDHPIMQMPNCLHLFIYLMAEAEWQEGRRKFFGGEQIILKPGQLTCGRKQIAVATRLTEKQIRVAFKNLRNLEIVATKPTNKMTLVTIVNWDTYQNQDLKEANKKANGGPTEGQRRATPVSLKHLNIKKSTLSSNPQNSKSWEVPPSKEFLALRDNLAGKMSVKK